MALCRIDWWFLLFALIIIYYLFGCTAGPTQVGPTSMPAPTVIIEHINLYITIGPNTVNASHLRSKIIQD